MALAALPLFSNRPCHCSSSITTFHLYPPNPSHSLQPSLRSPSTFNPLLQTQPSFRFQFRPSIHSLFRCRCGSYTPNDNVQLARLISLFEEIGISFEQTKLLLLNASGLTSIQLDSLRVRVLSLHSLGLDHMTINYLVSQQLNVLTSNEIDPLLSFLRNELQGQLNKVKVKQLLSINEPKILFDFPQKLQLLIDRGIAAEEIVHVLNKVNLSKAICHRSMEEIERIISFLEPFGGVDLIVKHPVVLNFDLDHQLKPKIGVLMELSGGDEAGTGEVVNKYPIILNYSAEHVEEHIQFFRSFAGFDDQQIFRIAMVYPAIFTSSRDRKLRPRIQFLKECGLDSSDLFKFFIKAPVYFNISYQKNLAFKLMFLVKIGYKYRTKEFAEAIAAASRSSIENMQKVISLFLNYGLSFKEIVYMSKKHPLILQYNHTSMEKKMKYLVEEMDRDILELLDFPAFLGYKFDERIKHRYELKKYSWERKISINLLLAVSNKDFRGKRKRLL